MFFEKWHARQLLFYFEKAHIEVIRFFRKLEAKMLNFMDFETFHSYSFIKLLIQWQYISNKKMNQLSFAQQF